MKQLIAILIAFFVCVGATQVSAQQVLNWKIVSTDSYTIEPTDVCILITGTNKGGIIQLPDPEGCKGRVIQIVNRKSEVVIVHPFRRSALYPPTGMLKNTSAEWVSDGFMWYMLNKSW